MDIDRSGGRLAEGALDQLAEWSRENLGTIEERLAER